MLCHFYFRAKRIYIGGLLFYSCGMCMLALTRAPSCVIIFSWCAGVMYSTLFTMPYLLVAHYHSEGCVCISLLHKWIIIHSIIKFNNL